MEFSTEFNNLRNFVGKNLQHPEVLARLELFVDGFIEKLEIHNNYLTCKCKLSCYCETCLMVFDYGDNEKHRERDHQIDYTIIKCEDCERLTALKKEAKSLKSECKPP
jgi:hypothetical protein